jgi:beta-1,4-mannosyltransferase
MNDEMLLREYQKLCPDVKKVYVVPLINYSFKKTNYLYLLYKNFIEKKENYNIDVKSISVFSHPVILVSRLKNEKSILHYHWLEINDFQSLCGMFWKIFWISLFKLVNGKIIWTVHNEFPHSNNFILLNRIVRNYMARIADRLHVHCASAVNIMLPLLKVEKNKFFVAEHPDFPVEIIDKNIAIGVLEQQYFRGKIKSEDSLFLMFGEIAEYKGIKEIVEIFNNLEEKKKLIIAGIVKKGNNNCFKQILGSVKNKNQVLIRDKRITDDEVPLFFNSCDYSIFNFNDVLTSGSVVLSLNYNKKIIIPAKGCLTELSSQNIIHFNNKDELKNILINI